MLAIYVISKIVDLITSKYSSPANTSTYDVNTFTQENGLRFKSFFGLEVL